MSFFSAIREFAQRTVAPTIAHCDASKPAAAASSSTTTSTLTPVPADSYTVYHVLGFPECPWFHRASCIAQDLERQPEYEENIEVMTWPMPREEYAEKLDGLVKYVPEVANHQSCPAVLSTSCVRDASAPDGVTCQESTLVGGYSELEKLLKKQYNFKSTHCEVLRQMTGNGKGAC